LVWIYAGRTENRLNDAHKCIEEGYQEARQHVEDYWRSRSYCEWVIREED